MKKQAILILFSLVFSEAIFSNENVSILREKLLCKPIYDYFCNTEYQKKYPSIFEIVYGIKGIYDPKEAFKLLSQIDPQKMNNGINTIENYLYYGIDTKIYKISHDVSRFYYVAITDITGIGVGFEFFLFNEKYDLLDRSIYVTKYKSKQDMYEFIELYKNNYGILINTNSSGSGHYAVHLTFVIIYNDKFKEVFSSIVHEEVNGDYELLEQGKTYAKKKVNIKLIIIVSVIIGIIIGIISSVILTLFPSLTKRNPPET